MRVRDFVADMSCVPVNVLAGVPCLGSEKDAVQELECSIDCDDDAVNVNFPVADGGGLALRVGVIGTLCVNVTPMLIVRERHLGYPPMNPGRHT